MKEQAHLAHGTLHYIVPTGPQRFRGKRVIFGGKIRVRWHQSERDAHRTEQFVNWLGRDVGGWLLGPSLIHSYQQADRCFRRQEFSVVLRLFEGDPIQIAGEFELEFDEKNAAVVAAMA